MRALSKMIAVLGLPVLVSGCGVSGGSSPGASASTLGAALSCAVPTTVSLDFGQNTGAANTARGVWSDVKFIPTGVATGSGTATGNVVQYSSNVGVAYVDTGAQALKFAYWSGSTFTTEIVAGDAAANITYVRLGFLSNSPNTGLPIIFYANGAVNSGQIMMAARSSASLTAGATWNVTPIDVNAGTTNRALELSISPTDQVALVYQGVTAPTANNIRFVYCSSSCATPSNYVSQSTSATSRIDNGATATQTKIGVGWCQMSAGIYNPAVVYGASATAYQFAICNTGASGNTLTSCLTNAGWTRTTATIPVTGASGITSDLYLDASISGDTPKMMVKDVGGAQMKTFQTSVGCNSVVAGTTYTAAGSSALVGSGIANYANSYFKILKAPNYSNQTSERFFVVANDGTTAIKWSASSTSSFNGAWNTNNAGAIQTVTLNGAGATNLGADLSMTSGQLIASYGTAAGTFDATLGVVNNFLSPGDPGSASNIYYQLPIDEAGHMQLNATQYNNVAIASTSTNRPAVAWVDYSSGVATTGKLKYALRTGSAAANPWEMYPVPGTFSVSAPQYPSLAFDQNDRPWIGYWDAQAAGAGRFILATNTASDGSGNWTSYMFPVIVAGHGVPAAQPAANMTAVAMSYTAGVATPTMIVIDNGTALAVKAASLNPATGAWSAVTSIDTLAAQGAAFLTADFSTTSNLITIAYQTLTTGGVRVKYTASTDGSTWPVNASVPYPVSNLAQGEGATVKINPVTGLPSIAYYDRANARLYLAQCTTNCTGTGVPVFTGTSSPALTGLGIAGLSGLGNSNLLTASLTFSNLGVAYVLYNSGQGDTGSLRLIDNTGGTIPSTAPLTVVAGRNGNLTNASATNGAIPWNQRSIRLSNGVLATAYVAPGSSLSVTSCGD